MEELKILFEDNHIMVVIKPQNIPTQGDSSEDESLLDKVKKYIKEKYEKPGNVYVGLVHRLDRPTGGVMVFAKTSKAAARLSEQLVNGDFDKKYVAVTTKIPLDRRARLMNYLVKDEENNIVKVVSGKTEEAKLAVLDYTVLETNGDFALLDIKLVTGRSHQARVQLSYINAPIFADNKYGVPIRDNLALWAYQITFAHPISKQTMVFRVFPPVTNEPWKQFHMERHLHLVKPE